MIRQAIQEGSCDAVTIARALIANNDLVKIFEAGIDRPLRPCTHCNKCLVNVLENPLGCYEVSRYDGDYERMVHEILSVYDSSPFGNTVASSELFSANRNGQARTAGRASQRSRQMGSY